MWTVTGDLMNPTSAAPPTAMMTPFAAGRKTCACKWAVIYRTSLFQQEKPPGVCAQETVNYVGTSSGSRSVQPSASELTPWHRYIEVCRWSERERKKFIAFCPRSVNLLPTYKVSWKWLQQMLSMVKLL